MLSAAVLFVGEFQMLTKQQQLFKNKKPKITNEDREYLNWLNENRGAYPCFVCGTRNGIEYHHVKNKSTDKKNHRKLIPLCYFHHRVSSELSPHGSPKNWRMKYSIIEQEKIADKLYEDFKNEK